MMLCLNFPLSDMPNHTTTRATGSDVLVLRHLQLLLPSMLLPDHLSGFIIVIHVRKVMTDLLLSFPFTFFSSISRRSVLDSLFTSKPFHHYRNLITTIFDSPSSSSSFSSPPSLLLLFLLLRKIIIIIVRTTSGWGRTTFSHFHGDRPTLR